MRFIRDTTSVITAQSIITKVNKSLKEGIRTDSFEVAQSRDGLPRSKIGGSSAAACSRRDLELEVTQRGKSWKSFPGRDFGVRGMTAMAGNHSPGEILACGV